MRFTENKIMDARWVGKREEGARRGALRKGLMAEGGLRRKKIRKAKWGIRWSPAEALGRGGEKGSHGGTGIRGGRIFKSVVIRDSVDSGR